MTDSSNKPRHWRHVIRRQNPDFLYAEDLGPAGFRVDVEVIDSGVGVVKNPTDSKDVIWLAFRGARKKLGIGATGCKTMAKLSGSSDWADWRGWITLVVIRTGYFDTMTAQREETDAIRIAPVRPAPRERLRSAKEARGETTNPDPNFRPAGDVTPDEAEAIARDERERLAREGQS